MPGSCEVCSSEPSKYRCPICALMSCSLACTQTHKIYCAPKQQASNESSTPINTEQPVQNGVTHHEETDGAVRGGDKYKPASIAASPELTELFRRQPNLRDQLHDIYQSTLEDEWVEWYTPPSRGRFNVRGGRGGRAPTRRSRGPWTSEKGFNRGVGRVRKFRQDCEEGSETGAGAEAFMRFWALVNNSQDGQPDQSRSSS
ncbi:hypothetical protein N7481_000947 [Penicillium waksmanii]|uniref:uncharacterized protein n=1 Tax=Penicillium waksmanii TaxID=69791 RepID=UPI002547B74E|nr:uncharacterized protein N7481_000947 [Penicillium waksmanii]KAJ6000538.1 hypothetical protein N7481_000947 [Penicillium waksmanii]